MIIVTGGAGFIGSNIVKALNDKGITDILIVDDLTDGRKCRNLSALQFSDYMDCIPFDESMAKGTFSLKGIDVIFHEGACSDTMEYDGRYMMQNNFEGSKNLFHYAQKENISFIYASSASTYGNKTEFVEESYAEEALNPYAFSKLFFLIAMYYLRKRIGRAKWWDYVILMYSVLKKIIRIGWLL